MSTSDSEANPRDLVFPQIPFDQLRRTNHPATFRAAGVHALQVLLDLQTQGYTKWTSFGQLYLHASTTIFLPHFRVPPRSSRKLARKSEDVSPKCLDDTALWGIVWYLERFRQKINDPNPETMRIASRALETFELSVFRDFYDRRGLWRNGVTGWGFRDRVSVVEKAYQSDFPSRSPDTGTVCYLLGLKAERIAGSMPVREFVGLKVDAHAIRRELRQRRLANATSSMKHLFSTD